MKFRFDQACRGCAVALSVLLGTMPAHAALLQNVTGNVVVNRGEGFEPVKGSVELVPGDQVVVGPGGTATLSYGGGCNVPVGVETVAAVAATAPCAAPKPGDPVGKQVLTQAANPGAAAGEPAGGGGAGGAGAGGAGGGAAGEAGAGGAAGEAGAGGAAGEAGAGGAGAGGAGAAGGLGGLGTLGTVGVVAGVAGAVGIAAAVASNSSSSNKSASP